MKKDSHCSYCGAAYLSDVWPRHCDGCGQTTWRNPTPVAVVLAPVDGGILLVRRNIEPQRGKLALPGGYVDYGETWQQACARELFEETGVRIDADEVSLLDCHSSVERGVLLLFGLAQPMRGQDLPPFVLSGETSEIVIVKQPVEVAFGFHQLVLNRYFELRSCP